MTAQLLRGVAGIAAGAVFGVAAVTIGYWRYPAITLEMDHSPSSIVSGLYEPERAGIETFAWTRKTANLTLPGLDRRVDWSCTIRLRGARVDTAALPLVAIAVDERQTATVQTTNDYVDVPVTVPAAARSRATVTLTVSNTFVPGPADARALGVMIDRWTCRPAPGNHLLMPPRPTLFAAAFGGAALAAAFALLGASIAATIGAAAVVAAAQAVPLGWEFGMFTAYPQGSAALAAWIAVCLVALVRGGEWATGCRSSAATRFVVACAGAVLYLKLLVLLHPSKPPVDVVFHAHRLQWVLDGRFYFTQPMPSGVRFPYAIGLYVFAAPWTWLTDDYVLLLRVVVSAAEAVGALLVYLLIARAWGDRVTAVAAASLFHLVPRAFNIVGNANLTNAFAQSVALAAIAAAVLWPLQAGHRRQVAGLTLLTAAALLSHISTFTLLGAILLTLAALYWLRGGATLRRPSLHIIAALVAATVIAITLYYGHFGDAYRSAARVRASTPAAPAGPAAGSDRAGDTATTAAPPAAVTRGAKLVEAGRLTVAAVGWPILVLALAGTVPFVRRGLADRLSLAVLALLLTLLVLGLSVVVTPVDRSFQRYAAEFVSRVTLATYPAMVILAGAGVAWAWRAGWAARIVAASVMLAAIRLGVQTWIEWLTQ